MTVRFSFPPTENGASQTAEWDETQRTIGALEETVWEATESVVAEDAENVHFRELLPAQEFHIEGGFVGWDGVREKRGEEAGELVQDEVYLFSLEKGFLMLRPDLRQRHGIVTANVTVSAHDPCLGGTVIQVCFGCTQ